MPIEVNSALKAAIRAFSDGREAVVFGWPLDSATGVPPQLLIVDLASGRTRSPAPLPLHQSVGAEPVPTIGVSRDNRFILTAVTHGNASTVVAIARDGSSPTQSLFTTTSQVVSIDEDTTGRIYLDQIYRSIEHLRVPANGGSPELLAAGLPAGDIASVVTLPDGRTMYATVIGPRT